MRSGSGDVEAPGVGETPLSLRALVQTWPVHRSPILYRQNEAPLTCQSLVESDVDVVEPTATCDGAEA